MTTVATPRSSYIAGEWADAGELFAVENPADESHVADVAGATPAEASRAVAEARRSFDSGPWADFPAAERARVLPEFLDRIEGAGRELGGKSAQIYLDDAVGQAARGAAMVVAMTAGQACVAATRMLVPQAAMAVARRLRTGAVNVNAGFFSAYSPGGGYKQSGLGRERGTDGIRAFQELKHMAIGNLG